MWPSRSVYGILIDLLTISVLFAVQQILTSSLVKPNLETGFYCNDFSVNLEFKKSTVTNLHLIIISLVFPIVSILFIELLRSCFMFRNKNSNLPIYLVSLSSQKTIRVPEQIGNLYANIGYFLFGLLFTNLITNVGKLTIGRLRPNFLSVCQPNIQNLYTSDLCRTKTYLIPNIDFKCMQPNPKEVFDSRKSFPSGHSSLSFFSMVYLALFLSSVWQCRQLGKLLPRTIQLTLITFALFVALSRVSDHKHHPTDVIAGSLIGILCALFTFSYHRRFLNEYNYKIGGYHSVGQKEDLNEPSGRLTVLENSNATKSRV